jgi:hypothetical protein
MGKFSARFRIEVEPNGPNLSKTQLQNLANQLTKELFKSTEKVLLKKNL